MKKEYVRPVLVAERFSVAEHIASCGYVATWAEGSCVVRIGGINIFADAVTNGCDTDVVEMFHNFDLDPTYANAKELKLECYNAFMDPMNTFFTSY